MHRRVAVYVIAYRRNSRSKAQALLYIHILKT